MRRISFALTLICLAAALPASAQTVSKDPALAPTGTYTVDTDHTQVLFSILHLGLTDSFGRFDKASGTLAWNGSAPEQSTLQIMIDMTSLDMPSSRLNNMVKTVFRTEQFPSAVFKSTAVKRTGPDTGEITGTLTIKDVTKPVTLDVMFNGSEKSPLGGGIALGFRATTVIKRSDFGLNTMIWSHFVGDDVRLIIEAMFDQ